MMSADMGHIGAAVHRHNGDRDFDSHVVETFNVICEYACTMMNVSHSGFVRFDHLKQYGEVVAQYPQYERLLRRKLPLKGVPAEDRLLESNTPLVITDVRAASADLGEVRDLLLEFDIQSICIVQVFFRGVAFGSFSFDSVGSKREFTEQDKELCRWFANIAETMIENAQMVDWFEAFEQATVAMTSESDPDRLMKTIVNQANLLFDTRGAGLYLRESDVNGTENLRLATSEEGLSGYVLPKGVGMAWQLVDGDKPFLTTADYRTYPQRDPNLEGRFRSVLEVPLIKHTERIGVIYLSGEPGREFTGEDARRLQRFADMATLALQNSRLISRMEKLSAVAADISGYFGAGTLDDKLTAIARHATNILNAEMCGVFIVDKPGWLVLKASHGHAGGRFERNMRLEIRDEPQSGFTGAIAKRLIDDYKSGRRAVFNAYGRDLVDDPAIKGHSYAGPEGTCYSLLAIPLIRRLDPDGNVISGMLRISNKRGVDGHPRETVHFRDEDEWILRIFAESVVLAIQSAELVGELQAQKDQYRESLDAWNTLVSTDPLRDRLCRIASHIVYITGKSFCRILLAQDSRDHLSIEAAAVHPAWGELEWNEDSSQRSAISEWPLLHQALRSGQPYELLHPHETLDRLSDLLDLRESGRRIHIQALFSVPLISASRAIGLLSVWELSGIAGEERGFTANDTTVVTSIAAQVSLMIDREWRQARREDLLSRVPEALGRIRAEADADKNLRNIAEHVRSVFECGEAGFVLQRAPGLVVELITTKGTQRPITQATAEEAELLELLATDPASEDPTVISNRFADLTGRLSSFSDVGADGERLAVRIEFPPNARALLFVADGKRGGALTTADLAILERLGNHCATSLTQAHASDQLKRARDGVHRVAKDLAVGDQGSVLQNVVEGIRSATGSDIVTLYRTRPSDGEIVGAATVSGLRQPGHNVRPSSESAVGRILQKNDMHIAEDARSDLILGGDFVRREDVQSSMGNTVWLKDEIAGDTRLTVGVLFVNYTRPHKFTRDEVEIVKMFSHLAAIAIRNQDVFERERRKARTEEALRKSAKALSSAADMPTVASLIAQEAFQVAVACAMDITIVAIGLIAEGDYESLEIFPIDQYTNRSPTVLQTMSLHDGASPVATACRAAKSILVTHGAVRNESPTIRAETRSQLTIPIIDGVRILGVICIESATPFGLDREGAQTLEFFAESVALDSIRAAMQRTALATAKLREEALTDLALFHIKAGVIIHEHRGTIQSFVEWAKFLKFDAEKEHLPPQILEDLKWIDKSKVILEGVLRSTTADFGSPPLHLINTILTSWQNRLRLSQAFDGVDVIFDIDASADVYVRVDADLMHAIFSNFSRNSLRAMQTAAVKRFIVTTVVDHGNCRITVADTGTGMDAATAERIRSNLRSATRGSGIGVGLLNAQLIITKFGGEVVGPQTSSNGTTFTITLPAVRPES